MTSTAQTFRNLLVSIRSPEIFAGRVFLLAFNALVLSSVFWRVCLANLRYLQLDTHTPQRGTDNTAAAAREILGFIIFTVAMSMFTSFQALPICTSVLLLARALTHIASP